MRSTRGLADLYRRCLHGVLALTGLDPSKQSSKNLSCLSSLPFVGLISLPRMVYLVSRAGSEMFFTQRF